MAKQKINPSDVDVSDLANVLAKTIADATSSGIAKGFKDAANGAKDLSTVLKEQIKEGKTRLDQLKNQAAIQTKALDEEISGERAAVRIAAEKQIAENKLLITKHEQSAALAEHLSLRALEMGQLDAAIIYNERLLELQNDVSGLKASNEEIRNLADEMDHVLHQQEEREELMEREREHAEKLQEIAEESKELLGKTGKYIDTMKAMFTDSTVAAGVFVNQLNKGREVLIEAFEEVRKEGYTVTQAFHETGLAVSDYFSLSGASAKDSLEAMSGLKSEMGSLEGVTREARLEVVSLAKTFGISNVEAGKLTAQFAMMPGATMESANNTLEFAGNLAKAAHLAPGEVMSSIASNTEDVAKYSKDGGKNIAVAAVAAKKLGVEFSAITKATEGLLDFENSINAQMEASVLLGKEINLDKAREMALNGDILGSTQEMLKNIGGEAEFNQMNVLQRQKLAAAMGVSVQDLAKMVKNQDKLTNLSQEQQEALSKGEITMDEALANAGGFADKLMEGTKTIGGYVLGFGQISSGLRTAKDEAKSLFGGIMSGYKAMKEGGGIKGGLKGALGLDKAKEGAEDAAKDSAKVKGGGGFKGAMKGLAGGFKEMGAPKVREGIKNVALAGPAMILGIAATPFMGIVALLGKPAGMGLQGLSEGLKGKGMGAALVEKGIANLTAFSLAGALGLVAIPFMFTLMLGKLIGKGLEGLAGGLKAMGNGAVAFGVGVLSLLVLSVGAGMMMFGIGVGIAAAGMALLVTSIKDIPFENLMVLPMAFTGLAAGLSMVAAAGALAMPILSELILLAAVAPALVALGAAVGNMFGGGGGEEKEDKMDILISEIRSLKTEMSKGGVVNLDGKKVGDTLRLAMNTSGVR